MVHQTRVTHSTSATTVHSSVLIVCIISVLCCGVFSTRSHCLLTGMLPASVELNDLYVAGESRLIDALVSGNSDIDLGDEIMVATGFPFNVTYVFESEIEVVRMTIDTDIGGISTAIVDCEYSDINDTRHIITGYIVSPLYPAYLADGVEQWRSNVSVFLATKIHCTLYGDFTLWEMTVFTDILFFSTTTTSQPVADCMFIFV